MMNNQCKTTYTVNNSLRTVFLISAMVICGIMQVQADIVNMPAYQSIPTNGALDWESFEISGESYLAVANNYDGSTYSIDSKIYRWDGTAFIEVQSIPTHAAIDWESFEIGGETYLAVANDKADSKIYKWYGTSFIEVQSIPVNSAYDWESFEINSETYLAVANYLGNSTVYKWYGTSFIEVQSIPTDGANDWESFEISGESYLAVANVYNGSTVNIDSKIYKWDGATFTEMQSIPTSGARSWESFRINGTLYLAVANSFNGSTDNIESKIYKWDGVSFIEVQSIPTNGAFDWEEFEIDGESYLAVANSYDGSTFNRDSKIYKWDGAAFVEAQSVSTNGAKDWESFRINGRTYLALANFFNDSTFNIDSKIVVTPIPSNPVADPGDDSNVLVGNTVHLDGSRSFDPEGDPLSYVWSFVSKPAGSFSVLVNANSVDPGFLADVEGAYEISLIVNDGSSYSDLSIVTITAITPEQAVTEALNDLDDYIGEIPAADLHNNKSDVIIAKHISKVLEWVIESKRPQYQSALNTLANNILIRTDGCAFTGEPDNNDWLLSCDDQAIVYPLVLRTIELVERMKEMAAQ